MRITTLLENSLHPNRTDLKAEHGLSFFIELTDKHFMSDVGASAYFAENAKQMGVDLTSVDALAITHHHYDHGGGLERFFQENPSATVYLRWAPKADYIAEEAHSMSVKYIGLDQAVLEKYANRITYLSENTEILPGVHLLTTISSVYPKPSGDNRLKMRSGNQTVPDTFAHELVTVLVGEQGLVILTGCAHNSVLNLIEATRQALPGQPIQAVIGGFHLRHENLRAVQQIGEVLLNMDIPEIYTGHCTGDDAVAVLKSVLGDRLHRLHTGLVITV